MNFLLNLNWLKILEISIPAFISIVSVFFARRLEKQKIIDMEVREKKIKIYGELTKLILEDVMGSTRNNKQLSPSIVAKYPKICNDLIFWGSDKVVKQYQNMFQGFSNPNLQTEETMSGLENLLLAIRKDVGHKNEGLEKFDLIKVFVNDVDKSIEEEKKQKFLEAVPSL